MAVNFLEQLVAEWYEFQGYFVRRNIKVGPRLKGGYDCELDVVAFHPGKKRLVHIEPSMDADPWPKRVKRYTRKFEAGRKHIPSIFAGLDVPTQIEQIALLGFGSKKSYAELGGGRIQLVPELLAEIIPEVGKGKIASAAVSEQFPLLRTLQFVAQYRKQLLTTCG